MANILFSFTQGYSLTITVKMQQITVETNKLILFNEIK